MQAMRRRDVLRARAAERRKLVLLERAMPSAQARKAAAETRRVDSARATETERMERTSARRCRHRAEHPEEEKFMVTGTPCPEVFFIFIRPGRAVLSGCPPRLGVL